MSSNDKMSFGDQYASGRSWGMDLILVPPSMSEAPQWLLPCANYDFPRPPHPRCNYASLDGLLLVGAMPSSLSEQELLVGAGVALFVDLSQEGAGYAPHLQGLVARLPVGSGRAPSLAKAREMSARVRDVLRSGRRVYVHCHGGNGRANTLAALVLGEEHRLNALQAINLVQCWRRTRPDRSRTDLVPIPETTAQVNFLVRALGVPAGMESLVPDRSDMSWLAEVKRMRRQ